MIEGLEAWVRAWCEDRGRLAGGEGLGGGERLDAEEGLDVGEGFGGGEVLDGRKGLYGECSFGYGEI